MSKSARKPGDGRGPDSLPADDPSIPVLTERLTLPPLDLDLDFRLPPRPAPDAPAPAVPPAPIAYDDDATRYVPRADVQRIDLPSPEPTAFEPRYPVPDDEKTRLSLEGRRAFDPSYLDDDQGTRLAPAPLPSQQRDETSADAAPAQDEGTDAADATQFDTRRDTAGGTALGTNTRGPDSLIGPDSVIGPNSVITPNSVLGGPITVAPPPDLPDGPRVPTSLLVSNLTQPASTAPTHRRPQQDDFDVLGTQPGVPSVDALDNELRERILLDLARRLPSDVDAIVRRHLETAIDEAVRRFAAEVRIALAGSLREIVDRAVKGEMERLKGPGR